MSDGAASAALPRVLLVEDDASIRRFVEIALEELPIDFAQAASLADARAALAAAPARLVICDLMLPDGSGLELLQALSAAGGDARPRLVAFSAGISAERRTQLCALGVDEVLAKPVSLEELEGCVRRALDEPAPAAAPPSPEQTAIERFFAGDAALFHAYRAGCLPQFERDLLRGDAAAAAGDAPAAHAGWTRLRVALRAVIDAG